MNHCNTQKLKQLIKYHISFFFIVVLSLTSNLSAQIVSSEAFLQGSVLEVGVAQNGSFGSSVNAPAGYHPRAGNLLGFISDTGQDGFDVGTPPFDGDFFLPGSPEEVWGISFNNTDYNNSRNDSSGTAGDISGSLSNYQNDGTSVSVEWNGSINQGPANGLDISMRYSIDISDPTGNEDTELTMEVTLTNTRNSAMTDVYWMRSVDPDNNQNLGDGFSTLNTVVAQRPTEAYSLVNATQNTNNSYIQLSSADPDSRVIYGGFSNRSAEDVWNVTDPDFSNSGSTFNDIAIALAVRKTIPGNSSVTFTVSYRFVPEVGILDLSFSPEIIQEDGIDKGILTATLVSAIDNDVTVNLTYSGTAVENTDYRVELGTNAISNTQIVIPAGEISGTIDIVGIPEFTLDGDKTLNVNIDSLINAFEGDTNANTILVDNDSAPCNGQNLYFSSNLNDGTIYSGDVDGSSNVSYPGLATSNYQTAVDHTTGFVYRTAFGNRQVFRYYYSGVDEREIYSSSDFSSNILAIGIDVDNKNIYVAEFGGNNRLYCMPADGSGPVVEVNSTLSTVTAITIDNENDRIFIYERGPNPDRIRVANFGANCEALTFSNEIQNNALTQSFGIDYDELNNRIYIGETNGEISRYEVGSGDPPTNIYTGQGTVWGIGYLAAEDALVWTDNATGRIVRAPATAGSTSNIATGLSNVYGLALCDPYYTATVTVTDGSENNSGSTTNAIATITLNRPNTTGNPMLFDVAFTDISASSSDYDQTVAGTGVLSIANNETTTSLIIPIREDTLFENDETFVINVTNPSSPFAVLSNPDRIITIRDDDNEAGSIEARLDTTQNGDENSAGAPTNAIVSARIGKINNTSSAITFDVAISDVSTTSNDYNGSVAGTAKISIPVGSDRDSLEIPIVDDFDLENTEEFRVTISNASDPAIGITQSNDLVSIIDDDSTDIAVAIEGLNSFYMFADNIEYNIIATNQGSSNTDNITLEHNAPFGSSLYNWTCEITKGNGSCDVASGQGDISERIALDSDSQATFNIKGIVELKDVDNRKFIASVESNNDSNDMNDSFSSEFILFSPLVPPNI